MSTCGKIAQIISRQVTGAPTEDFEVLFRLSHPVKAGGDPKFKLVYKEDAACTLNQNLTGIISAFALLSCSSVVQPYPI